MSDPEWLAEVQRWLRYAREDLTAAEALLLWLITTSRLII